MIQFLNASLHEMAIHFVGNPSNDEPLTLSESLLMVEDDNQERLLDYFMNSFKPEAFYRFTIEESEVYARVKRMFEGGEGFLEASAEIASHLYDVSTHPKILSGDLFTARIRELSVNGEFCDAIVLVKAEIEDQFAQVEWKDKHSEVVFESGYRLNRIDKACVIFSLDPSEGYHVLVIDKTNGNSAEAQYWTDAFLGLEALEDSYHHTQQFMHLTKEFLKDKMPEDFEVNPAEQIALLNRSSKFFKEKDKFEIDNFADEVIQSPEVVTAFKKFTESYSEDPEHSITEQFDISKQAVKKHAGMFKSVLKLDKNFHIYVHGNRQLIERGYDDDKGMNYYKVFFSNESTT
jgi:hypothetical protein